MRADGAGLPEGYRCAGCGYPTAGSGSVVCPECGRGATAREIEGHRERAAQVAAWEGGARGAVLRRWTVVVGGYSAGAVLVGRDLASGLLACLLLGAAVWMAWLGGALTALVARADHREFRLALWRREMWGLQLPWLVAPVALVALLISGLVDVWAGDRSEGVYVLVGFSGFWLWGLGCLGAFVGWWVRLQRRLAAVGVGAGRSDVVSFVLGLLLVGVASVLGFGAGAVVFFGVASWLGIGVMV